MFFNELKFLKKKENAILIHTTIWINHRIIMQIERNQTKKKTFYMVPFIYNSILSTITASRRAVAWGWWVGRWCKGGITERRHNLQHCLAHTLFPLTKIDKPNKKYDLESPRSWETGNSLSVQWLGLRALTVKDLGSIPGWGTKIPQALRCSQK